MRDTMLRQQRDSALFQSYQEALKEKAFNTQKEAIDYVISSPAPEWFVSREFCAAVISSRLRGKDHYKMGRSKRRKFDALFELYQQKRKEFPYCGYCHLDLCEAIVSMPAPEWFLGSDIASKIIVRQMHIRNERMARRYGRK